jgi:hypothetical protein
VVMNIDDLTIYTSLTYWRLVLAVDEK